VKTADVLTAESVAVYPDVAFADPVRREFPIFDKASTWLSAAYFLNGDFDNPAVEARIKDAADQHDILDEFQKIESAAQAQKSASAPAPKDFEKYALTVDFAGEFGKRVENFYPLTLEEDVIASAHQMHKDASSDKLPVELFRAGAVDLVKAANEFGVQSHLIHDSVWAIGTERMPDFDHARAIAATRVWGGAEAVDVELYKDAADAAEADPTKIDECINLWLQLDDAHNVKYSRTVLDPYQAFYAGPDAQSIEKMARENVIIEDVLVPAAMLTLPTDKTIRQNFEKGAAAVIMEARKFACEYPQLASREIEKLSQSQRQDLLRILLKH
jgi:hypothetical protein